jgi:tetratricopeptide (TPR) repeat protein
MRWQEFQQSAEEAQSQGQLSDAERLFRSALQEAKINDIQIELSQSAQSLAHLLAKRSAFTEAEGLLFETLNTLENLSPRDNLAMSGVLEAIGTVYLQRKEWYRAAVFLTRAAVLRKASDEAKSARMATLLTKLAAAEVRLGNLDAAETLLRRALKKKENIFGSEHPALIESLYELGALLGRLQRYDDAEVLLLRALNLVGEPNVKHPLSLELLKSLAEVYAEMGQPAASEDLFRRAIAAYQKSNTNTAYEIAKLQARIDKINSASNQSSTSSNTKSGIDTKLDLLLQEFEYLDEVAEKDNVRFREVIQEIAEMLEDSGKYVDALRFRKQEMDITHTLFGYKHPESVRSLSTLVHTNILMEDLKEAGANLQEIMDIQDLCFGITPEDRLNTYLLMAELARRSKDFTHAENWIFHCVSLLEVSSEKAKHRVLKEVVELQKMIANFDDMSSHTRLTELHHNLAPHQQEKATPEEKKEFDESLDRVMREHGINP